MQYLCVLYKHLSTKYYRKTYIRHAHSPYYLAYTYVCWSRFSLSSKYVPENRTHGEENLFLTDA